MPVCPALRFTPLVAEWHARAGSRVKNEQKRMNIKMRILRGVIISALPDNYSCLQKFNILH
jgi:hypothetical protein